MIRGPGRRHRFLQRKKVFGKKSFDSFYAKFMVDSKAAAYLKAVFEEFGIDSKCRHFSSNHEDKDEIRLQSSSLKSEHEKQIHQIVYRNVQLLRNLKKTESTVDSIQKNRLIAHVCIFGKGRMKDFPVTIPRSMRKNGTSWGDLPKHRIIQIEKGRIDSVLLDVLKDMQGDPTKSRLGTSRGSFFFKNRNKKLKYLHDLIADKKLLNEAMQKVKGHSEDYLYDLILHGDFFEKLIIEIGSDQVDSILLIMTSELSACPLCSLTINDMVACIKKKMGIQALALFASCRNMRDQTGLHDSGNYITEPCPSRVLELLQNQESSCWHLHLQPSKTLHDTAPASSRCAYLQRRRLCEFAKLT